ncbi:acyl-CoA dehydrogenase [Halalkalibacillus sediminis]|uniref:Acyl-CoA dehydrogenase n=1 Tax=Halalkalibacillus sediminis TaxID=2018042 RepID=A0A2I0QRV0_9BACI|nr:acyl-CoA dehydrogenase family protein [Halalkalibacillus sediminis]PKR77067.1 acyl-CoA dehydrogenase [Halalkalibacillus sediminis]
MGNGLFLQNERQHQLYDRASQLADQIKPFAKESDKKGQLAEEIIQQLKNNHYLSMTLPEEYGGEHLSLYEWLVMQEKIAEGDGATALSVGWHLGIIMELRDEHKWTEENFEFLAREVSKQKLVNRASTERNTGSPTRGGRPETTAIWDGQGYILNGRKTFTTLASHLDYAIVSAYIEDDDQVGSFLVDMNNLGVSVDRTWDTLGMRGTGSDDLVLQDVRVKQERLVERKSGKRSGPKGWLLHIPACYLGIASAATREAVEFSKSFQPNSLDHTISKEHHIREKIGEMEMLLMRSRHLLYRVAEKWDQYPERRPELMSSLAVAKVSVTNDAQKIVDLAMRVSGGRGLSKDALFEKYYRDVRAGLHNPPMDDMVLEQFAKDLLDD